MIKVKSIKDRHYAGKVRKAGEFYDCEERYVKVLAVVGFIEVPATEPQPAPQRSEYNRRDMRAKTRC